MRQLPIGDSVRSTFQPPNTKKMHYNYLYKGTATTPSPILLPFPLSVQQPSIPAEEYLSRKKKHQKYTRTNHILQSPNPRHNALHPQHHNRPARHPRLAPPRPPSTPAKSKSKSAPSPAVRHQTPIHTPPQQRPCFRKENPQPESAPAQVYTTNPFRVLQLFTFDTDLSCSAS